MPKRQSTTAKVTLRIARLISRFNRMTNNGVLCRIRGEEYGVTGVLRAIPEGLCIYKLTLEQISRMVNELFTLSTVASFTVDTMSTGLYMPLEPALVKTITTTLLSQF